MNINLKPLVPDPERAIPGFSVCDIEAMNWIEFLMIGLYFKVYDKEGNFKREYYKKFESLEEFCEAIFDPSHPHDTVFAHFGGKYDFSFIIGEIFKHQNKYRIHEMLPRGSGLLCFNVSKIYFSKEAPKDGNFIAMTQNNEYILPERTITFRDSSAMLPFSLGSLTENFGVKHKKMDIDHTEVTGLTPELEQYAEWDHRGLYEVIETYYRWPIIRSAGPAMTVASQALKVFRTFIDKPIYSLSKEKDTFVRQSYFGGRTEIFKPFFQQSKDNELLRSYDANSLYPAVMQMFDYPNRADSETTTFHDDRMGFYEVDVYVPDMYIPPLGMRFNNMEDKLIFPTGTFRGVWSAEEIKYAMTLGCKILKVHKGLLFKNGGPIFRDYIDTLYDIRKKSDKNSVNNILCKLLMNSSYGKFSLNLEREKLVFDYGQTGVRPHMEIPDPKHPGQYIRLMVEDVTLDQSFSNVAIASYVTSYARIWMHKLYNQAPEHIYYTDTDSIKSTYIYDRNDDELGKLKLEYKSKRAAFILPKTYMEDTLNPIFKVFDTSGKEVKAERTNKKLVMKGFDKKKIAHFTFDDFASALEGDMRRLAATNPKKFATLRTAVSKGKFLALLEESPRQIRTRYNKRRVFKRDYAQVYDTEPLHIKDGEIQNLDKEILKKWKAPTEEDMAKWTEELNKELGIFIHNGPLN